MASGLDLHERELRRHQEVLDELTAGLAILAIGLVGLALGLVIFGRR